jgi:hypothetical protein
MFKKNPIEVQLDEEILQLLKKMEEVDNKTSDDYVAMLDQMSKLYKLRQENSISMDTWATIGANLAGIIIILNHERAHVIATKSLGLVRKLF